MRLEGHEQESGEEQSINRADDGGLEEFTQARCFLVAADALFLLRRGKKVLNEGNDAFGGFCQKAVFVRSAYGFGQSQSSSGWLPAQSARTKSPWLGCLSRPKG